MADVTAGYGTPFDFIAFFLGNFIHNWRQFISVVFFLHQTFRDYVPSKVTLFGISTVPNVTAGYGRLSDLIALFGNFLILLHVWSIIS